MPTCSIEGCTDPARSRGWCRHHYDNWLRHRDPLGGKRRAPKYAAITYLREIVQTQPWPKGCLIWPYDRFNPGESGYGRLSFEGRRWGAHVLSCTLAHGPGPEGHEVLHSCHRPPCVNPRHLRWGTHAQNMRDRAERRR